MKFCSSPPTLCFCLAAELELLYAYCSLLGLHVLIFHDSSLLTPILWSLPKEKLILKQKQKPLSSLVLYKGSASKIPQNFGSHSNSATLHMYINTSELSGTEKYTALLEYKQGKILVALVTITLDFDFFFFPQLLLAFKFSAIILH